MNISRMLVGSGRMRSAASLVGIDAIHFAVPHQHCAPHMDPHWSIQSVLHYTVGQETYCSNLCDLQDAIRC